jgi:PAS domain S-box-containing protein
MPGTADARVVPPSEASAATRRADPARLFWRFYGGVIAVIAVLVILLSVMIVRRERALGLNDIRIDLRRTGQLTAEMIAPALASGDRAAIARIGEVARSQGLRVTVVGPDGRVLADSSAEPDRMDNHLSRPEIAIARNSGVGEAERRSATTGDQGLYYAVAIIRDGTLRGFVRTAATDRDVEVRRSGMLWNLALGSTAVVAVALWVGFLFMRRLGAQFRGEIAVLLERDLLYDELKASQSDLAVKQRRLNEAQQIARLGSFTWDVRTNAVTWSDSMYRILGFEPGAIAPSFERYQSRWHADERVAIDAYLRAALETKQPFEYDQRLVMSDGAIRVVQTRGEVLTDAAGATTFLVGTVLDVTERAAAEEAQRRSEERFQLATRATNDALWDWVPGTNAVWWNDGFYTLFGYARAGVALTRDAWIALIHPDDREAVRAAVEQALASDETVFTCEYRLRRADGVYAWVFDRGYLVRGGDGQPLRMIGSMMDITSRKDAERMKSDFVSFVSHQLRTPLSGMNWMLELANDTPGLPDEARGYIAEARESAARLGGLVNDLLDVSRLESGRLALTLEIVELETVTRSVLDEARTIAADKGHHITLECIEPATIHADAQLMRQAVANLVSNAIKYTPPGGTIRVALTREHGRQQWTVTDSGIGIPKAAQGRLFEKFFRADNAVSMATEGTGLGLHLVRLIVEQFGGTIWCDSAEGHGATFGFALPVAEGV